MTFELKTTYSITDLAEMLDITRYSVRRMLRRKQVPVEKLGKRTLVGVDAFREAFPTLWSAVLARADIEEGAPL
jgi:hypothetical protein